MFMCCFGVSIKATKQTQKRFSQTEISKKSRGQAKIMIARLFVFCARGRLCSRACCSLACFGVGGVAEPSAADLGTPGDCGVAVFIHACVCVLRGRVWSG